LEGLGSVAARSAGGAGAGLGAALDGAGGALLSPPGVVGAGGSGCWLASAGERTPSSAATPAAAMKDLFAAVIVFSPFVM
jgi:hypothetical protein